MFELCIKIFNVINRQNGLNQLLCLFRLVYTLATI